MLFMKVRVIRNVEDEELCRQFEVKINIDIKFLKILMKIIVGIYMFFISLVMLYVVILCLLMLLLNMIEVLVG